jgi:hypothetical protein
MAKKQEIVRIGEIEIPSKYFKLPQNEKEVLCGAILETILTMIDRSTSPEIDRFMVLDKLLESSIITNESEENYEICCVLKDVRNLINEQNS